MPADAGPVHVRPPKLPFWRTVGRAYAIPFMSFGTLVHVAWLWLVVAAPFLFLLAWLQVPYQAEMFERIAAGLDPVSEPGHQLVLTVLQLLVIVPPMSSIAVAWHRLIINGERPTGTYFRIDRNVVLYAGFLLAVWLLFVVLGQLPALLTSELTARGVLSVVASLLTIGLAFVLGRLSLVLPPIALGRTDIGLGDAWRATRRNTWRLFLGPIICLLIVMLPSLLIFRLVRLDRVTAALGMTAIQVVTLLAGVVGVGFLSLAYQHFFEGAAQSGR